MAGDNIQDKHWALDRKIPLVIILGLVIQSASIAFWAGKMDSRVTSLEYQLQNVDSTRERVIKVETILDRIDKTLTRIERRFDDNRGEG